MKVALASTKFVNRDIAHNVREMEKYMRLAKDEGADVVCFSEAFLQGFDGFTWSFDDDVNMAVSVDSELFRELLALSNIVGIDILFGFLEREGEFLYSSCALVGNGELIHLYRRITKGWKEYTKTDAHYREGTSVDVFEYRGRRCLIALCGDLWDEPERFAKGQDILFWPVYVNFAIEEWEREFLREYTEQAALACDRVLMVNAVSEAPDEEAFGGCFFFANGAVRDALPMGKSGLLVVEI